VADDAVVNNDNDDDVVTDDTEGCGFESHGNGVSCGKPSAPCDPAHLCGRHRTYLNHRFIHAIGKLPRDFIYWKAPRKTSRPLVPARSIALSPAVLEALPMSYRISYKRARSISMSTDELEFDKKRPYTKHKPSVSSLSLSSSDSDV